MTRKKKTARRYADDLRGASRLVVDATKRVTDVVQGMHQVIASGPAVLGRPLAAPVRALTALVYGSIRGVVHGIGSGIDAALGQLAPLLGDGVPGPQRAALLAALNGVVGDVLAETGNALAIEMALHHDGQLLELDQRVLRDDLPGAGGKLLVLLHGSSVDDSCWQRAGHPDRDHGTALAHDLGYTPVYLAYNSGLHVSTNGRAFAEMLDRLVGEWPAPITELVLLGHSMGGLVARSACHHAEATGQAWRAKLTRLVCLGTPHHGAPLERSGNLVDLILGLSSYSAPLSQLGKLRSAGITDLRYGNVLDEHWEGRDRFAHAADPRHTALLPTGVRCYAVAATKTAKPRPKLRSDGMVPVDSALGRHPKAELTLAFPLEHQWIGYAMGHLDLLSRAEVYQTLHAWLAS